MLHIKDQGIAAIYGDNPSFKLQDWINRGCIIYIKHIVLFIPLNPSASTKSSQSVFISEDLGPTVGLTVTDTHCACKEQKGHSDTD